MARIDLVEGGLIYTSTFASIDPVWIISPNGAQAVTPAEGLGLRLDPSQSAGQTVLALYSQVQPPYVIEAELEYSPSLAQDNAGLTLWANSDDAIYLSVVTGGTQYDKLRFKVAGERCEGYAYSAALGLWEVAGTAYISADMLPGLYVEGASSALIKRVRIVRDTRITVGNLPNGYSILLLDAQGLPIAQARPIDGAAVLSLDQVGLAFEGELQVRDASGNVAATTGAVTINGGNVYWYNAYELNLYLDGQLVVPGQEMALGPLVGGVIEKRLEIENAGAMPVSDVAVSCVAFNTQHGQQWTALAPEIDGSPGAYGSQFQVPQMEPGQRVACWLKIARPTDIVYYPFTEHRFALLITTGSGEAVA